MRGWRDDYGEDSWTHCASACFKAPEIPGEHILKKAPGTWGADPGRSREAAGRGCRHDHELGNWTQQKRARPAHARDHRVPGLQPRDPTGSCGHPTALEAPIAWV